MTAAGSSFTTRPVRRATIVGTGSCVPDNVVTNFDLEKTLDTNDEWIRTRTGIGARRVADADTSTADLAFAAARQALERAGVGADEVGLIIVATVTPDMATPSTASILQDRLGAVKAAAFDLEAACSGFMYALVTGSQFITAGAYDTVLVVGAETLSKITDWSDRTTAILLGDGAGAVVLQAAAGPDQGLLSFHLGSDGSGAELICQPAGGSRLPASEETVASGRHFLQMRGREVFKFAVKTMGDVAGTAVEKAGLTFADIDLYVPHQANYRIIEASAKRYNLPMSKVFTNIERYGNTSAGSIPIALDEVVQSGRLGAGDKLLMVAFGGGLTWGAAVMNWTMPRVEQPQKAVVP